MKRPVRSRMQGVVEAGGETPPAIRLGFLLSFKYAIYAKPFGCFWLVPSKQYNSIDSI